MVKETPEKALSHWLLLSKWKKKNQPENGMKDISSYEQSP